MVMTYVPRWTHHGQLWIHIWVDSVCTSEATHALGTTLAASTSLEEDGRRDDRIGQ